MSGVVNWMRGVAALIGVAFLLPEAHAASLTVFPVRVMLSDEEQVQTVTVRNSGDDAARMQLRVYAWTQEAGEDVFTETRDVLANPALFEIGPGREQIVRLGFRGRQGATERSYRVFLEEVPQGPVSKPGKIRALLRISLPMFVPPFEPFARVDWRVSGSGRQAAVIAGNAGNEHVQITRLTLTASDGSTLAQQDMSAYLLPGTSRRIALDLSGPISSGDPLRIEALTDGLPLSADIVNGASRNERVRP